jgi:hypothetical protein
MVCHGHPKLHPSVKNSMYIYRKKSKDIFASQTQNFRMLDTEELI